MAREQLQLLADGSACVSFRQRRQVTAPRSGWAAAGSQPPTPTMQAGPGMCSSANQRVIATSCTMPEERTRRLEPSASPAPK
ncbi:hypothetical protein OHA77_10410 [Streptosporangium sp. NBC_01639]|uniref:hypothetical protein n=1 Tax=Streptosporangium sp. NBC_01639 TaxID=2975948 RepID=UPI0038688FD7|nr:hypothetical protein OHA77_10410 [Streptosporangium sp. NBC_01639]